MAAKNHISIVPNASPLGDRTLSLVNALIQLVSDSHRVRKVMDKVDLDGDLPTHLGVTAENATEVKALIVAFDNALSATVVSNVTDRLG